MRIRRDLGRYYNEPKQGLSLVVLRRCRFERSPVEGRPSPLLWLAARERGGPEGQRGHGGVRERPAGRPVLSLPQG